MKRLLVLTLVSFTLTGFLKAQDAISTYFSHYETSEDVTFIELSGKTFELLEGMDTEGEDEQRVKELASQVTGLRMVIDTEGIDGKSEAFKSRKKVSGVFEELMMVKEKEGLFYILIDERDGIVYEILAFGGDSEKFFVADLKGQIRLQDVTQLTSDLSKVNDNFTKGISIEPGDVNIYPNPASQGQELSFDLPNELEGGKVLIMDASGKKVHEFVARGKSHKLSTEKIGTGVYIMKVSKGAVDISKKFLIQ